MSKTIEIDCPKCGRKIGIPQASETIHVTCPKCREQWDWYKKKRVRSRGDKWKRFEAWADRTSLRTGLFLRDFLGPRRFTGVHIVIAVLGGSVLGFIIGMVEGKQRAERFVHPIEVSAPAATNAPASTNQPSQLQDLPKN